MPIHVLFSVEFTLGACFSSFVKNRKIILKGCNFKGKKFAGNSLTEMLFASVHATVICG